MSAAETPQNPLTPPAAPPETDADDSRVETAGKAEMSPSEAVRILREGGEIEHVKIVALRLKGEFPHEIRLRNVTLVRPVIQSAVFQKNVGFHGCTILRPIIGKQTEFQDGLFFSGCSMKQFALRDTSIVGHLSFEGSRFTGNFVSQRCQFGQGVRLWNAHFECWTDFVECRFPAKTDFRSFHTEQGMQLQRCEFLDDFLMRGASVSKKLDFGSSRFEGLVDLSKAKLHDFVYLERIEQGENQQFAFANLVGERIQVRSAQLQGRIKSENDGDHATAMQEFGLLKRSFETLHRYEEEDWAFYRFKVNQRKARPQSWKRPWTKLLAWADLVFLDYGCGYGASPFRAVGGAVVLMLLFAVIYAAGIHSFQIDKPPLPDLAADHFLNRVIYGLVTSVSVFTAGFTGEHLTSASGWMLAPLAVEALFGTLLWGLFIVAFSRKVIR